MNCIARGTQAKTKHNSEGCVVPKVWGLCGCTDVGTPILWREQPWEAGGALLERSLREFSQSWIYRLFDRNWIGTIWIAGQKYVKCTQIVLIIDVLVKRSLWQLMPYSTWEAGLSRTGYTNHHDWLPCNTSPRVWQPESCNKTVCLGIPTLWLLIIQKILPVPTQYPFISSDGQTTDFRPVADSQLDDRGDLWTDRLFFFSVMVFWKSSNQSQWLKWMMNLK